MENYDTITKFAHIPVSLEDGIVSFTAKIVSFPARIVSLTAAATSVAESGSVLISVLSITLFIAEKNAVGGQEGNAAVIFGGSTAF